MENVKIACPAKINLSLDVVGKRQDGYHLLRMLMQTVGLFDYITVEKVQQGIELTCSNPCIECDERNTAYKMARLVMDRYSIPGGIRIHIDKRIPAGAGLAGGSTDAAGIVKAMNQLFQLDMPLEEMLELGLKVGADVPYCIMGGTALAEGIGERLTSLRPIEKIWCVIAKPGFSISTKEAYGALKLDKVMRHPETEKLIGFIESGNIRGLALGMVNVLEDASIFKYPEINIIKDAMMNYGALGSIMTGSGSAVFGLFMDKSAGEKCCRELKKSMEDVFLAETC